MSTDREVLGVQDSRGERRGGRAWAWGSGGVPRRVHRAGCCAFDEEKLLASGWDQLCAGRSGLPGTLSPRLPPFQQE